MQLKYSTALLLATIDAEQSAQAHQDHDRVQPHRHNNLREGHLQRRLGTFDSNGVGNDGTPPGLDNNPGHCKEGDPEFIVGGVTYTCEEEFNEMGGQCRTQDLTEEEKAQAREDFEKWKKEKSNNGNGTKRDGSRKLAEGCGDCVDWDNQVITIPTWFHVIHDGNKGKEFTYGENEHYINNQIKVMNDAFRGLGRKSMYSPYRGRSYEPYNEADIDTKIQFCLQGTTATDDKDWYNAKDQTNMKRQLDEGGMETLNVYAHTADGYLGWAYYPQTSDFDNDGVIIYNESFPGGGMAKYSEGDTCTHEVGHWLNLQHTHGNGCDGPGDYMDDAPSSTNYDSVTANEETSSFYCPIDRDNCNKDGGKNPIHNFMAYTQDNCMDEFSPGQKTHLHQAWETYRHKTGYSELFSLGQDGYSCLFGTSTTTTQPVTQSTSTTSEPTPTATTNVPIAPTTSTTTTTTQTTTTKAAKRK